MNQADSILAFLKDGRELSTLDAVRLFGTTRLGARIHDLRRQGHPIRSRIERNGKKFWSVYSMPRSQ